MKKKWLIGIASCIMVVALSFGLAACGDNGGNGKDDALVAQKAIDSLNTMYGSSQVKYETDSDYIVLGKVNVDGELYNVSWSAEAKEEGVTIGDYVSIGEMDADNQIVVDITMGDVAVEYTLKASVTIGSVTKVAEYDHLVPQQSEIYTVAQIIELAKTITGNDYLGGKENPTLVYVKGYVIKVDGWNSQYNNWTDVYIADSATATESEGIQVYRLGFDEMYIKQQSDLVVGAEITLRGWLQAYNGTAEISYYPISPYDNVTAVSYKKPVDNRTEGEKIADALKEVPATMTVSVAGDVTLPESKVSGVTFKWASSDTTYTVANGKLKVTTLPSADKDITLTVTATCGNSHDDKTVAVKILAAFTAPADSVTGTVSISDYAAEHGWVNGSSENATCYSDITIDEHIKVSLTVETPSSFGRNSGKYYSSGSTWRIYQTETPSIAFTADEGYTILAVKVTYSNTNTGVLQGENGIQYASGATIVATDGELTLTVGNTVDGTTNGQARITKIEVIYLVPEGAHRHNYTYTYNGDWTHNATCSGGEDCDEPTITAEACDPVENKCVCGHEFSTTEIFEHIKTASSMKGTYKLTGVIDGDVQKSTQSGSNAVRFNMNVGTTKVIAYFVEPGEFTNLKDGDTVTIVGELTLYQNDVEFKEGSEIVAYVDGSASLDDAGKIAAAKAAVEATDFIKTVYTAEGTTDLPTANSGATISWSISGNYDNTIVELTGSTLNIKTIPSTNDYVITLVATISSGSATSATVNKEITIKAASAIQNDGSDEHPYTIEEVRLVGAEIADDAYLEDGNGAKRLVHVEGYVVKVGTWDNGFQNFTNTFIATSAETDATSDDAFCIYRLYLDQTNLKLYGDLAVGNKIVVCGYLQNYKGNNAVAKLQITSQSNSDKTHPVATSYTDTRNEEAKVAAALANVQTTLSDITKSGDVTLPESSVTGVTLEWSTTNQTYTIDNKSVLKVNDLPDDDTALELSVKAVLGTTESSSKTVTVNIIAPVVQKEGMLLLNKDSLFGSETAADGIHTLIDRYTVTTNGVTSATEGSYSVIKLPQNSSLKIIGAFTTIRIVFISTYDASNNGNKLDVKAGGTALTADSTTSKMTGEYSGNYEYQLHTVDYTVSAGGVQTIEISKSAKFDAFVVHIIFTEDTAVENSAKISAVKLAAEAEGFINTEFKTTGTSKLPIKVSGVSLEWSIDDTTSAELVEVTDNVLNIKKLPSETTTVKLKAVLTCGIETEQTVNIEIHLIVVAKTGSLELSGDKLFSSVSGSGYAAHDNTYLVGAYSVTTSNVMKNTYNNHSILQFKSGSGTITLSGSFTKITVVLVSTSETYNADENVTIKAGTTPLTGSKTKTESDTANSAYLHTVEFTVSDASELVFTISGSSSKTSRIESILFTEVVA